MSRIKLSNGIREFLIAAISCVNDDDSCELKEEAVKRIKLKSNLYLDNLAPYYIYLLRVLREYRISLRGELHNCLDTRERSYIRDRIKIVNILLVRICGCRRVLINPLRLRR